MITFVTFLGWRIAKEETFKRPRIQLVSVLLRNLNKGYTTKDLKRKRCTLIEIRKVRGKTLDRALMT